MTEYMENMKKKNLENMKENPLLYILLDLEIRRLGNWVVDVKKFAVRDGKR